jgi:hypothetical protein
MEGLVMKEILEIFERNWSWLFEVLTNNFPGQAE